jgi:hypothetical protein
LGPLEFEARLADGAKEWQMNALPDGVVLTAQGTNWLRFKIDQPELVNPLLIRQMLENKLNVISFQEVTHSLEMAYLEAVTKYSEAEV